MASISKILFLFLFALLGLLPWKQQGVAYEAALGRYGADCAGRGVCSFTEAKGTYNSRLSYSPSDSVLTMQLLVDKFLPATLRQQFGDQWDSPENSDKGFVMESDYILPATLKERLSIPRDLLRIQQGQYKKQVQNGFIIVGFKIK